MPICSQLWFSAGPAGQAVLHGINVGLANMHAFVAGGAMNYAAGTGIWTMASTGAAVNTIGTATTGLAMMAGGLAKVGAAMVAGGVAVKGLLNRKEAKMNAPKGPEKRWSREIVR